MTAVRLRGRDAIDRAIETRRLHLEEHMTVQELADHYECSTEAIRLWLNLAKKHTLPDLDDKLGWFNLIVQDQGARLEDAKDADSVRIAQLLSQLLGVGSLEELRAAMVRLEASKVALIATAFDKATKNLPERHELRELFMQAIESA